MSLTLQGDNNENCCFRNSHVNYQMTLNHWSKIDYKFSHRIKVIERTENKFFLRNVAPIKHTHDVALIV